MLHILTPLFRFNNLEKIYNSILVYTDITWHIAKSNRREDIDCEFIKTDKRIVLYNVDCEDNEIYKKRNTIFENIKDGYFCLLDDDTLFHENMYIKYLECLQLNFQGMLIGEQLNSNGKLQITASKPIYSRIDTGNVLCYHLCLKECRWPDTHIEGITSKDFLFWEAVYKFYGNECGIWNQPISYYNKLVLKEQDE